MTEETKLNCSVNHNYREGYQQGRADAIDECITNLLTESITCFSDVIYTLEQLKEQK